MAEPGQDIEGRILAVVEDRGPIKAAEIAAVLSQQLSRRVTKKEVNGHLYGSLREMTLKDPSDHTWRRAEPRSETIVMPDGIVPTPEQREIVTFEPSGHLLIRGEAGSGKTTVLAARAGLLQRRLGRGSLLFVTYNKSLATYVESMLRKMDAAEGTVVRTVHGWALDFVRRMGFPFKAFISIDDRKTRLGRIVASLRGTWGDNHLFGQPVDFWSDEVAWIYGQGVEDREVYRGVARAGRGTAVQVRGPDRDFVWEVFARYHAALEAVGEWDSDNPSGLVRRCVEANGGGFAEALRVDHVFVDEVQDFHKSWFLALTPVARQSITLAGDLAQRIYKRHFTWKEVGIRLTANRSRRLQGSLRTTRSIMEVALHLATNPDLADDEDYVQPSLPDRDGPRVRRVVRPKHWQALADVLAHAARLAKDNPGDTLVVAVPFKKQFRACEAALKREGLRVIADIGEKLVTGGPAIRVTTYHQLKGLEFDHVVLTHLEDDSIPGWFLKGFPAEDLPQEEAFLRRLVYVAMTRARESVTLSGGRPFCRFFDGVPQELFDDL